MWIVCIALCQFICQFTRIMFKHKRIRAGIVAAAKFVLSSFIISKHHFRIFTHHPSRKGCRGSGKYDIVIFFRKHIHDLVKLIKIIFMLRWLDLCP